MAGLAAFVAQLATYAGDVAGNVDRIAAAHAEGRASGADLVVTPELSLSGGASNELFARPAFLAACRQGLQSLAAATRDGPALLVGLPWSEGGSLRNAVACLEGGEIRAMRFKVALGANGGDDEGAVFAPGPMPGPVAIRGTRVGLPVGSDLGSEEVVECLQETGAELLISPARTALASGGAEARLQRAIARVVESELPVIVVEAVGAEDAIVFDGGSFALDARLAPAWRARRFVAARGMLVFDGDGGFEGSGEVADDDGIDDEARALRCALAGLIKGGPYLRLGIPLTSSVASARLLSLAIDAVGRDYVVPLPLCERGLVIAADAGFPVAEVSTLSRIEQALSQCLGATLLAEAGATRAIARRAILDMAGSSGTLAVIAPATVIEADRIDLRCGLLAPFLGLDPDGLSRLGLSLSPREAQIATAVMALARGTATHGDVLDYGTPAEIAAEASRIMEGAARLAGMAPALRLGTDSPFPNGPRRTVPRFRDTGAWRTAPTSEKRVFQPRVDAVDF
jgi:predicted amidohydrolase